MHPLYAPYWNVLCATFGTFAIVCKCLTALITKGLICQVDEPYMLITVLVFSILSNETSQNEVD